ncbi:MAG: AAA family ATPase [Patescibacteria group bacterium]|jgi:ATP-dependent Clp protease ATP-binding subunit ClpA|nr:AAA family ATPase [Patescibacteria group bacterium]
MDTYILIFALVLFLSLTIYYLIKKSGTKIFSTSKSQSGVLSRYSVDLTQSAQQAKMDPIINRTEEIRRVTQILSRRTKNNPVLIGKAGVGKTAIVEGLAQKIVKRQVPIQLIGKRVISLDLGALMSGTKYRGEFEERIKAVLKEIEASQRQIILFIDELHILANTGGSEGGLGAADILKPLLARGDLQVIGASTFKEYFRSIKKDSALERRFQPVYIKEPSPEETLEILNGLKSRYEEFHKVEITEEAIREAIELGTKYLKNRYFPDKAIDLIDEAASKVKLYKVDAEQQGKEAQNLKVTAEEVRSVFREWMDIEQGSGEI